jgi:PPOX class probable F420-dependent enzyme
MGWCAEQRRVGDDRLRCDQAIEQIAAWCAQTHATLTRSPRRSGRLLPMSRRDQIKLSEAELLELLEGERIAIVSSLGPRGWPHSMPMWFVPRAGKIWIWTYAKSQKVRNLERDPRATVLIETGREYGELRGVMIEAEAEIHRDGETVLGFAEELTLRYAEGISSVDGNAKAALEAQAPKRVAIHFKPTRTASWDHRKLGGSY